MFVVYLGLGSNVGDRLGYLRLALEKLQFLGEICAVSSVIATPALLPPSNSSLSYYANHQNDFFNFVVKLRTLHYPLTFLKLIQDIEITSGRPKLRNEKWAPRNIDIDMLLWDRQCISSVELTIPHPEMRKRYFVLYPLVEITPDLTMPDDEKSCQEILSSLPPTPWRIIANRTWQARL